MRRIRLTQRLRFIASFDAHRLARIERAYCGRELTTTEIRERFNISVKGLYSLIGYFGWPMRGQGRRI